MKEGVNGQPQREYDLARGPGSFHRGVYRQAVKRRLPGTLSERGRQYRLLRLPAGLSAVWHWDDLCAEWATRLHFEAGGRSPGPSQPATGGSAGVPVALGPSTRDFCRLDAGGPQLGGWHGRPAFDATDSDGGVDVSLHARTIGWSGLPPRPFSNVTDRAFPSGRAVSPRRGNSGGRGV